MSRRKISQQQRFRILKIQEQRLKRAETRLEVQNETPLGAEEEGRIVTHHGIFVDVEDNQHKIYRCNIRQHLGTYAAGDRVIFCKGKGLSGVVVALMKRNSVLARLDQRGQTKPIAANIDQVIVVIACEPLPTPLLIDSYLVACHITGLNPVLLLNKIDLLDNTSRAFFHELLNRYGNIGYRVCTSTVAKRNGLSALKALLENHSSVFVGQSGVGKSSLINKLIPKANLAIGEISEKNSQGSHTTSRSQLFHLSFGGNIIDSPGIREFSLKNFSLNELIQGFPEFSPFIKNCKFRNCTHSHEPDCAILKALEAEKISQERYDSFQWLRENLSSSF